MSKTALPSDQGTKRFDQAENPPEAHATLRQTSTRNEIQNDRKTFPLVKTILILASTAVLIAACIWGVRAIPKMFSEAEVDVATGVAKVMLLRDVIVEQGTLESQNTVNGICQIEGYENKIIFLLPEGTKVKKGQVVVKFDDANILKNIAEQKLEITEAQSDMEDAKQEVTVQVNENESSIRTAKQTLEFAKIDLNKYLQGDFLVSKSDLEGAISEADTEVQKRKRELDTMRVYVKRGFRQYEQLRESEQALQSAELRLKRDKQKYDMLLRFDHQKKKTELEGKLSEAQFKLTSAKATAKAKLAKADDKLDYRKRRLKMKQERLVRLEKIHKKFVIKAPQDGTVAFPNNSMFGRENQIREGGIVYQNQTVFYLPNMKKMQVKVDVHESMVSKVKIGQKVVVRVDAFPNFPLDGVVQKVGTLAENSYFSTAKNYKAVVKIDSIPDEIALKPGMTAKAEIICGVYPDVLGVPVQALTTKFGKTFVYRKRGAAFERIEVEIDRRNVSFVEIVKGIAEGDQVALDAYERSIEDFDGVEAEELVAESDAVGKPLANDKAEVTKLKSGQGQSVAEPEEAIVPTSEEANPEETNSIDESKDSMEKASENKKQAKVAELNSPAEATPPDSEAEVLPKKGSKDPGAFAKEEAEKEAGGSPTSSAKD